MAARSRWLPLRRASRCRTIAQPPRRRQPAVESCPARRSAGWCRITAGGRPRRAHMGGKAHADVVAGGGLPVDTWIPSRYNFHATLEGGARVVSNLFTGETETIDAATWETYLAPGARYGVPECQLWPNWRRTCSIKGSWSRSRSTSSNGSGSTSRRSDTRRLACGYSSRLRSRATCDARIASSAACAAPPPCGACRPPRQTHVCTFVERGV